MSIFPIVIHFTGHHGLEDTAEEGRDYYNYAVILKPEHLPQPEAFKIVATKVRLPMAYKSLLMHESHQT